MSDGQSEACEMLAAQNNTNQMFWMMDRLSRLRLTEADTARAKQLIHDYVMKSKFPTTEMCAVYVLLHGIPMRRWYLEKGGPLQLCYQEMKTIKIRRTTKFPSLLETTKQMAASAPAKVETKPEPRQMLPFLPRLTNSWWRTSCARCCPSWPTASRSFLRSRETRP